jgi:hypothetical protein
VGGTGLGDRQEGLDDGSGTHGAWLAPRLQMAFRPAASPVRGPVAKLGGQPAWLERPRWPQSAGFKAPMMFVGQFPIPGDSVRMAYLFITDDPDGTAETFDPQGGENALLVQPGGRVPDFLATTGNSTGPSLWRRGASWDEHVPVELRIEMSPLDPAEEQVLGNKIARQEAERAGAFLEVAGTSAFSPQSYVGGKPRYWQHQTGMPAPWRFFFQLDGSDGWDREPYALNFGGGTGYAYLSRDEREGRFLWDCV